MPRALLVAFALAGCARNIPVPTLPASADVERGKSLAHSGMACVVCHSPRDWTKFGAPPVEGREFTGNPDFSVQAGFPDSFRFGASDLTRKTLGGWSDGEVARAILLGQRNDGHGLFPAMPYRAWRDLVGVDDVAAVIAYLRTLPEAGLAMPDRKFPMPGFVVDRMPEAKPLKETSPAPTDATYGAYVTARAWCVNCHTQVDDRGKTTGTPWAGGREFKLSAPGKGTVRSANLTPDEKTGLGTWTKEQFVQRFKAATLAQARATPVDASGFQTTMPWWAYAELTEQELGAIFDYLRTLPPVANAVVKHTP